MNKQMIIQYLPWVAVLIFVAFISISSSRKRRKEVDHMQEALKKGHVVQTIGGIRGRVYSVKEDIVVIETGPEKAKITMMRGAIKTIEGSGIEADGITEDEQKQMQEVNLDAKAKAVEKSKEKKEKK